MGAYFYPRPPRGGRPTRAAATDSTEPISIHALREEGDVCAIYDISELISFLSTPSARRATCCGPRGGDSGCYFYPRPPRGGRLNTYEQRLAATGFLSTPSARRATATATSLGYSVEISIHALREEGDSSMVAVITRRVLFLSTPSARRATPTIFPYWDCRAISIHALREEGDSAFYIKSTDASDFYPRPPRGGRPDAFFHGVGVQRFLSTPSARRATRTGIAARTSRTDFYPRPPRGGRQVSSMTIGERVKISIHALREEGDRTVIAARTSRTDFYPRPPRGGRHVAQPSQLANLLFLSTPSARRATPRWQPGGLR